jgi:hypothetical protein
LLAIGFVGNLIIKWLSSGFLKLLRLLAIGFLHQQKSDRLPHDAHLQSTCGWASPQITNRPPQKISHRHQSIGQSN